MFLESSNPDIKALSLSLHTGFVSSLTNTPSLDIANMAATNYADSAIKSLTSGQFILPLTAKTIKMLSPVQLWALNYVAILKTLSNRKSANETPYSLQCALTNYREKNLGHDKEMERLTPAEVTNIVFATEFDLVFAIIGIEHVLNVRELIFNSSKSLNNTSN